MNRIIILLTAIILCINNCYAIEEVVLDTSDNDKLTLNYINDVYYGRIQDEDSVSPILRLFSQDGLKFHNSIISSIKASFLYEGKLSFTNSPNNSFSSVHDFSTVEPIVKINFNEDKTHAMFDINLTRDVPNHSNKFGQRISQVYLSHDITKNQNIMIGQGERLPVNYDGSLGVMAMDMVLKSQIGRTFGEGRAFGVRNIAKYKYVDYDIGFYDSTKYMRHFGRGTDFTGYLMLKPLEKLSDKTGSLKIGAGYNIGEYLFSYSEYSVFAGYDYKKLHAKVEFADADGYNGFNYSNNKANGFYGTIAYDINDKFTIIARYDQFRPDKTIHNNDIREYTAGITYKPFKKCKFMVNYVRKSTENLPDSNMLLFATRFII